MSKDKGKNIEVTDQPIAQVVEGNPFGEVSVKEIIVDEVKEKPKKKRGRPKKKVPAVSVVVDKTEDVPLIVNEFEETGPKEEPMIDKLGLALIFGGFVIVGYLIWKGTKTTVKEVANVFDGLETSELID